MTENISKLATRRRAHGARKERLKELIAANSVLTGGDFQLASGGASTVFFDMKKTLLTPEGANLTADLILELIADDSVDAIGGLVIGACPIADAVCVKSHPDRPITAFYVRKEAKSTGTQNMIEGTLRGDERVVLVDDVTTKGGSTLRAVQAVRDLGCHVVRAITVVDRLEGARQNMAEHDVELVSLFTRDDFLD